MDLLSICSSCSFFQMIDTVMTCPCLSQKMRLKPFITSAVQSCRAVVMFALISSLPACSFLLTLVWQGQQTHNSFDSQALCMGACQSWQPVPGFTFVAAGSEIT